MRAPDRDVLRTRLSESPGAILRSFGVTTTLLFDRSFSERLDDLQPCHPHLPPVLDRLQAEGIRIGVVTSLPRARAQAMLQATRFSDRVDFLVAYGDTVLHKPDPAPILVGCTHFGCDPSDTVAVGDMRRDIVAAVRAGCLAVGVSWGVGTSEHLRLAGAARIVNDPAELLDYAGGA